MVNAEICNNLAREWQPCTWQLREETGRKIKWYEERGEKRKLRKVTYLFVTGWCSCLLLGQKPHSARTSGTPIVVYRGRHCEVRPVCPQIQAPLCLRLLPVSWKSRLFALDRLGECLLPRCCSSPLPFLEYRGFRLPDFFFFFFTKQGFRVFWCEFLALFRNRSRCIARSFQVHLLVECDFTSGSLLYFRR
jgi:hypothetical protein